MNIVNSKIRGNVLVQNGFNPLQYKVRTSRQRTFRAIKVLVVYNSWDVSVLGMDISLLGHQIFMFCNKVNSVAG